MPSVAMALSRRASQFPPCSEDQFGWFLKVLIAGREGTMLMCNVENGMYGWGTLGSTATGYFGSEANAFFAAVNTGAAGSYELNLGTNVTFATKLVVGLGQSVVITGDRSLPVPLALAAESFKVKEGGSLAMSYLALNNSAITVDAGAREVALTDCALNFVSESAFTGRPEPGRRPAPRTPAQRSHRRTTSTRLTTTAWTRGAKRLPR